MWTSPSVSLASRTPSIFPSPHLSYQRKDPNRSSSSNHHHHHKKSRRSLSKISSLEDAFHLLQSPTLPDAHNTYSLLLHACITKRSLEDGKRIHQHLSSHHTLHKSPALQAKLITLYGVCGCIEDARQMFDESLAHSSSFLSPSVWSAMLIAYSSNGFFKEALGLYADMQCRSVPPSNFIFSAVLKACSDSELELRLGRAVHAQVSKYEGGPDRVVNNALIRLYAVHGHLVDARRMFDGMLDRNIASWNSLLAGFVSGDRLVESLKMFRRMQEESVGFNWVTLTTVLPACARLTALRSGKEIHTQIIKARAEPDLLLRNSLMDMYAKCGEVKYSEKLFCKMPERDLTSWNVMLTCYAINGQANEALELFDEMAEAGVKPDGVSFIAMLSGCSHAGLTAQGQRLFGGMESNFGILPTVEHYACLVDILGRAGHIREALEVVEKMPMSPSSSIWGSLLNSCQLHHNIQLGERVAMQLFELEPNNPGNYVILSNMYATAGRWEDVKKVRELMESKQIKKDIGCSWIQVKDRIISFVAGGGVEFCQTEEYDRVWKELMEEMKSAGYIPNAQGVVLHNVDEEMKAMWVCGHSEKLAVVYGLIHTSTGMPIRITKNLRVCADCHSAMKIISMVAKRVIILRDTHRFHHFLDGSCSCKDYW